MLNFLFTYKRTQLLKSEVAHNLKGGCMLSQQFWKYFLILGICFNGIVLGEEVSSYTLVSNETHVPILTPSLAQRQTLKLRLPNGLEAYLIEDPEATHAGAVLTVQAGSWQDPDQFPGLAHFL